MEQSLSNLLVELEVFARDNDATITDRPRRMLNITRDTGEFLAVLVRATVARRILEIGTSNGYSTLWLADAARAIGGRVTTVERSEFKIALAARNFAEGGVQSVVDQIEGDAGSFLTATDDEAYDLIFLDSERTEYPGWWSQVRRILKRGGLLVVDNATSHKDEMAPFVALVEADHGFTTALATVGNGEFLAVRS